VFLRFFLIAGLAALPSVALGEAPVLQLDQAWVRALPPTQPTTAAYVTLRNTGPEPLIVTGATVEGAGKVEIHHTREVDGLMRMEALATLQVEAAATLELAPGGAHLMLFDLEAMPKVGESRRLCLLLADSEPVCTDAQVRKGTGDNHQHHNH